MVGYLVDYLVDQKVAMKVAQMVAPTVGPTAADWVDQTAGQMGVHWVEKMVEEDG